MPRPMVVKPTLPGWIDPAMASVFDVPGQGLLRTVVKWLGLDDPNQVMAVGVPLETGAATGGALDALAQKFPRFAKAIKAYHGSPHDFDKFSLEKIGTGEGAQAYGHGLYFAENPEVAAEYRKQLTEGAARFVDRNQVGIGEDALRVRLMDAGYRAGSSKPVADSLARDAMQRLLRGDAVETLAAETPAERAIKAAAADYKVLKPVGRTYEVAIKADPEAFLDWDKPLSQQSETVQNALKRIGPKNPQAREFWEKVYWKQNPTGAAVYQDVTPDAGGIPVERKATAAKTLQQAGIPGIKYLDQGSRAAGEGSRNYVVFDDQLVEILKKYGVALPMIEGLRRTAAAHNGHLLPADVQNAMVQ